jgi:tetratricopeptide (TPR) repeat protein
MSRYKAFISYSHADRKQAVRLHRSLEGYRLPRSLARKAEFSGEKSKPLTPVFLDREELATAAQLSDSVTQALDESAALVVVCSPAAVDSRWVNSEISFFRQQHPDRPVLAFVVGGEPTADPLTNPQDAAFPESLLLIDPENPESGRIEPLAADARAQGDGFKMAFLKLAAGLLGVGFDQLRQRELRRQQRRWAMLGVFSMALSAVFAVLAWQAMRARDEATAAREVAELELLSERQTRNFLLSVFELADPGEARGNDVTVREVLDRAVVRIETTQFARPVIKSRYLSTMGQAYGSLGLNQDSIELLQSSIDSLPEGEVSTQVVSQRRNSRIHLAEVFFTMGDYENALSLLETVREDDGGLSLSPTQDAQLLNIEGDILSYNERDEEAEVAYRKAIDLIGQADLSEAERVAIHSRSIGGLALLAYFAGDTIRSEQLYTEAASMVVPVLGETHPDSIWAVSSLASAAYLNGHVDVARESWTRLLEIALQVFDADHPEIATIKSSLGLLSMQEGRFDEARSLFEDAIRIDRSRRVETFDDLVYPLSNLAVVEIFAARFEEAEKLLSEAMQIIGDGEHRWKGPVLANLADLACLAGEPADGIVLAEQSVAAAVGEFGDRDWRSGKATVTLAYCKSLAGQQVDIETMLESLQLVRDRWDVANCYTQRAIAQAEEVLRLNNRNEEANRLASLNLGWQKQ